MSKANFQNSKKGASLFLAIMFITVLSTIMGGMAAMGRLSVLGGQTMVFTDDIFFIAESGIETGIEWLRNVDVDGKWYNNVQADGTPSPVLQYSLGNDKTVNMYVRYPATCLKTTITNPGSAGFLEVFSVDCFSEYGQIAGGEYFYVNIGNDRARISIFDSSLERLGIYGGADPFTEFDDEHNADDIVYPVTKPLFNIAVSDTTINVINTRGFLPAGTIRLQNYSTGVEELIRYNNKTNNSFTGCQRGSYGTTAKVVSASETWQILPVNFEATVYSSGTTNNVTKTLEVTVQMKDWE